MNQKKKCETEYRNMPISQKRRETIQQLTVEEQPLVQDCAFTRAERAAIKKQARKETRDKLYEPVLFAVLNAVGILLILFLCYLTIDVMPGFQDWALARPRTAPLYSLLIWLPVVVSIITFVAFFPMLGLVVSLIQTLGCLIIMHLPGGEYHRTKRDIQERLMAELAEQKGFSTNTNLKEDTK